MTMSDGLWILMVAVCVGTLVFLGVGIARGVRVLDPRESAEHVPADDRASVDHAPAGESRRTNPPGHSFPA